MKFKGLYIIGFFFCLSLACLFLLLSGCKKNDNTTPTAEAGTVTDIDGNVYKTVKIGNQWWMAEDLKARRYRNGLYMTSIALDSVHNVQWSNNTTGAYYDNTDDQNTLIGRFYNWYAITDTGNIAPAGWHVPSDDEWKELEKYLGMSQSDADKTEWRGTHEGEKLKVAGLLEWAQYGNVWATNESGFTALATGCRLFNGAKGSPGSHYTGFWWTVSANSNNTAWYRYLDYKNANVFRSSCYKNYGFSIRCVKD